MIVSSFFKRHSDTFWILPTIELGFSTRVSLSIFVILKIGDINTGVSFLFY